MDRKAFRTLSDPPWFSIWLSVQNSFGFVFFSFRCDIPKHPVFYNFDVVEIWRREIIFHSCHRLSWAGKGWCVCERREWIGFSCWLNSRWWIRLIKKLTFTLHPCKGIFKVFLHPSFVPFRNSTSVTRIYRVCIVICQCIKLCQVCAWRAYKRFMWICVCLLFYLEAGCCMHLCTVFCLRVIGIFCLFGRREVCLGS